MNRIVITLPTVVEGERAPKALSSMPDGSERPKQDAETGPEQPRLGDFGALLQRMTTPQGAPTKLGAQRTAATSVANPIVTPARTPAPVVTTAEAPTRPTTPITSAPMREPASQPVPPPDAMRREPANSAPSKPEPPVRVPSPPVDALQATLAAAPKAVGQDLATTKLPSREPTESLPRAPPKTATKTPARKDTHVSRGPSPSAVCVVAAPLQAPAPATRSAPSPDPQSSDVSPEEQPQADTVASTPINATLVNRDVPQPQQPAADPLTVDEDPHDRSPRHAPATAGALVDPKAHASSTTAPHVEVAVEPLHTQPTSLSVAKVSDKSVTVDATSDRQRAATSALNQLTVRNGTHGRVEVPELGTIHVEARQVAGAIAIDVRTERAATAETIQHAHASLMSAVRQGEVPVWKIDVEHDGAANLHPHARGGDARERQQEQPDDDADVDKLTPAQRRARARFVL